MNMQIRNVPMHSAQLDLSDPGEVIAEKRRLQCSAPSANQSEWRYILQEVEIKGKRMYYRNMTKHAFLILIFCNESVT